LFQKRDSLKKNIFLLNNTISYGKMVMMIFANRPKIC
jgi:hypothetical protein